MKILFLVDAVTAGGKERRMIELFKGLIAAGGYDITLISFTGGVQYPYLLQMPLKFIELPRSTKKDLSIFRKLYKLVKQIKPDIIHSWGGMSSIYLLPSLMLYRRAKFVNGIIADAPEKVTIKNLQYLSGRLTFPFSDAIISNSFAGIISYKSPKKRSHVIYNGMDFSRFANLASKDEILQKLSLKTDDFIIGMIAAFEERKDHETIIRAAADLQDTSNKIKFLLLGDGQLRAPMEELARELNAENILFAGRVTDVENYIQVFNIGVLTTNNTVHGEGISNALIECMAMGKPIIGTSGGGTNELIEDGINGYLIEPKNPNILAEKARYLFHNETIAVKMGLDGKKIAMEKFTVDRMTRDFIDLYQTLVQ